MKDLLGSLLYPFTRLRFWFMITLALVTCFFSVSIYEYHQLPPAKVNVIDRDKSMASRQFIRFLHSASQVMQVESVDMNLNRAEQDLWNGDVNAVLVLGKGFEAGIKSKKGSTVMMYTDASNIVIARKLDREIQKITKMLSAGINLRIMRKLGESEKSAMAKVRPLSVNLENEVNPTLSYAHYLQPLVGLFPLYILIILLTHSSVFYYMVHDHGWLRYVKDILAIVSIGCVTGLIGWIIAEAIFPLFGLTLHENYTLFSLNLGFFILNTVLMTLTICNVLFFSEMLGLELCAFIGMLSFMFSGATWPVESMPSFIQVLAVHVPFTSFVQSMQVMLLSHMDYAIFEPFFNQITHNTFVLGILFLCTSLIPLLFTGMTHILHKGDEEELKKHPESEDSNDKNSTTVERS